MEDNKEIEEQKKLAKKMLETGISIEQVEEITELPKEKILEEDE